ncbi:MAG: hypothetical protein H7A48_07935 [Akkermansiaceae bacterium]|nr:hypothetical protein [Akkermansiaceae bacterium]
MHPVRSSGQQPLDLWFMIGLTAVLVPMLATGRRLNRAEGGLLATSCFIYLAVMWPPRKNRRPLAETPVCEWCWETLAPYSETSGVVVSSTLPSASAAFWSRR